MSLQTIIDNATYVEVDKREQFAATMSRSGHYKTADRNINVYSFTIGMHEGLTYSTNRGVLEDIYTTGSTNEANISLNNNSGMNYLTAYQGDIAGAQINNITLNSVFGSEIYVDCSGATGSGNLFKKGDYIQPKGNTDTYRYPYQVTSDVSFSTGSNVTIPVHRPVLSQSGVALTSGGIKVGNDVRWQVKITNLPKYSVVPHDRIQFSDDFELVEVIT
tara:strand:+ start:220 stop:873 length:654 start_codon:yes stop_codon:yes gene_type:complete